MLDFLSRRTFIHPRFVRRCPHVFALLAVKPYDGARHRSE